ncbi:MAG: site-specific DNA-methyltransferase [Acidimicrobiales bacterium]|nr:site-specific DNA-methyltransferase [Acidimicrobiales bacterium]
MLGEHRVLCGDATRLADVERVMAGGLADMVWTDPPYGVGYVGKTRDALTIANDRLDGAGLAGLLAAAFANVDTVLTPGGRVYVAHPAGPQHPVFSEAVTQRWRLRQSLVWVKSRLLLGHTDYHYQHEAVMYAYKPAAGRWGRGGEVQHVLDDLRTRYRFALLVEHHAPKRQAGVRELAPYGSSLWLRWPELGLKLIPTDDTNRVMDVGRWRGDRRQSGWPARLERGTPWPWVGVWPDGWEPRNPR